MKKLTLREDNRMEFMDYARMRMINSDKNYDTILNNTFSFFLNHKLTVEENGKSYWTKNGKKEIECYGYSGASINERDNIEGMTYNLFHVLFCQAEWIARSITESWYSDTVKETIGNKNYIYITA